MQVETLLANIENDDEARTILALLQRENAKPDVLVTVKEGSKTRRYVVAREDRDAVLAYRATDPDDRPWMFYFGAQWLRRYGCVDEMYRSLSMSEVVKIETADPKRVWGAA